MRRKGIPGNCCGDTCGNKVRKINGISPDPNGEFSISAGAGVGITQDQNGITIDASAASGVLTINGQAPDADGNFDGVITGQPGSIGTNTKPIKINAQGKAVPVDNHLVDTASGQIIQGEKVFDSNTYTTIGIRSSRVSGKLGGIQFKDGSNNIVSTFEVDVDGDVHFENKPNTGVMIDNQRAYNSSNETDIVTIKTMKDNAVTIADAQTITGLKTFTEISPFDLIQNAGRNDIIQYADSTKAIRTNMIRINQSASENSIGLHCFQPGSNSYQAPAISGHFSSGEVWGEALVRSYNSAHTSDIVTIGSLAANPNVVHTVGVETINGTKRFGEVIQRQTTIPAQSTTNQVGSGLQFYSSDSTRLGNLYIQRLTNGKLTLNIELLNSDGSTYSYIALATST